MKISPLSEALLLATLEAEDCARRQDWAGLSAALDARQLLVGEAGAIPREVHEEILASERRTLGLLSEELKTARAELVSLGQGSRHAATYLSGGAPSSLVAES